MSDQLDLETWARNAQAAQAAADAAIEQVAGPNTSRAYRDDALPIVRSVARRAAHLTSDDAREAVERELGPPPRDPRIWGSIMLEAARAGWITKTSLTRKSARRMNHNRDQAVWRSRILGEVDG